MLNSISIDDIDNLIDNKNIIDVREPHEYIKGHLKGSTNIPMNILLMDPNNFLNKEEDFYLICHAGGRSGKVCQLLSPLGFKVINISGGFINYIGAHVVKP